MNTNKKSLATIIDKLAKKEGYPRIKLDHSSYMQVLKKAQTEWILNKITNTKN